MGFFSNDSFNLEDFSLKASNPDPIDLWTPDGEVIVATTRDQWAPQIINDGYGGSIITWMDERVFDNMDIYAQRINSTGDIQWTVNGVPVCTASNDQWGPQMVGDGLGGAIITWYDTRNINNDIFAQRINSTGDIQWTVNGIPICNTDASQSHPEIVSDGLGGAIITWFDLRNGVEFDIYAQRVNSTGNIQWIANGTVICTAEGDQYDPQIVSDKNGGAIIIWRDGRNGDDDIYIQHINSTGVAQWADNGTIITNANFDQFKAQITSDGAGGAIITWCDDRNISQDIYAQKVNSSGDVQWTNNGTAICTAGSLQDFPEITSDGEGGAIIAWEDFRTSQYDIYVQHINSTGSIQWTPNGLVICNITGAQIRPSICIDGKGGCYITWYDPRGGTYDDIYAQHINFTGDIQWMINGFAVCTAWEHQKNPQMVYNGEGVYITWQDQRSGSSYDVYAQRIVNNDNPTSNHPGIVVTSKSDTETINWILYDDFGGGEYRVWANNTAGNLYIWQDWQSWTDSVVLNIQINKTSPGTFNYTIEYYDIFNQFGAPDTVIVVIVDNIPTSNHPSDISTALSGYETINWILYDDFGGGEYRVWANNTAGNLYIWQDWQPWISDTTINVPINRSTTGIFSYSIEYYDNHNQFGIQDTVIVVINAPSETEPIISFGIYYLIITSIGIAILITIKKRKFEYY
ncbi:MAG: TolB family protein [Promethearchaeota archaeon]